MALGPFSNMPELFPKSTIEHPDGFKTVTHEMGYRPTAHNSGWRTSTFQGYTVTYSFDGTSIEKPQLMEGDKQEINSCGEMVIEYHAFGYNPPTRQSCWQTSVVPGYIVTYSWDFDPTKSKKWQDPKDVDRNSIGVTDSEAGSQDITEEEGNGSDNIDWVRELQEFNEMGMRTTGNPEFDSSSAVNGQEDRTHSGSLEPEPELQDIGEDNESRHSDSTDWDKDLRDVEYTDDRMSVSSDLEPELRERHLPVDDHELEHIYRELHRLDPVRRARLFEYLEMEQPGVMLASRRMGSINLHSFSDLTLKKILDLVLELTFEIEEGERETRYLGTVRDFVEVRTVTPAAVERPPLHWRVIGP